MVLACKPVRGWGKTSGCVKYGWICALPWFQVLEKLVISALVISYKHLLFLYLWPNVIMLLCLSAADFYINIAV